MAQSVLIYEGKNAEFAAHAKKWSGQWAAAEFKYSKGEIRSTVEMALGLDWVKYVTLVAKACKTAGKGGQLLFLVGHGGDITTLAVRQGKQVGSGREKEVGMFDLAPCKKIDKNTRKCDFRLDDDDMWYDYSPPNAVARVVSPMEHDFNRYKTTSFAEKKAIQAKFMEYIKYRLVGHCAQGNGLKQVVMLNCNVGNASDFMQKVCNDWQIPIVAFTRRLETREEEKTTFLRLYAAGEAPEVGSNKIEARYNYPQMHARVFKPTAPAGLPMSVVYEWLYPSKQTTVKTSTPPGKGQSAKPAKVGAR